MYFRAGDFNASLLNLDDYNPNETIPNNFTLHNLQPNVTPNKNHLQNLDTINQCIFTTKSLKSGQSYTSGSFYSDVSVHVTWFLLPKYPQKITKQPQPKRGVCNEDSKQKSIADLHKIKIDWLQIYEGVNPDSAFKSFLKMYSKSMARKCFQLQGGNQNKILKNHFCPFWYMLWPYLSSFQNGVIYISQLSKLFVLWASKWRP